MHASSWLRSRARSIRVPLLRGTAAGAAQALLMCAGAWLVAHVLARSIFHGRPLSTLWPALGGIVLIACARGALTVGQRMCQFDAGDRVVREVHARLTEGVRSRGPAWTARQPTGDLVTRLVDGVDALAPYYAGYLPQTCLSAIVPAIVLACVLAAEPWSALVLLGCAPLLPVFMVLVGKAAASASERRWVRLRRLGARFMDAISGLTTLRLYAAAERETQRLAAAGEAYRRETMAVLRIAFLSALVLEFFATVSIAVIAVMIGFRLMGGGLAFEPGMFALLLAPEFFAPLRAMGTQRHQRMEATAAAEGLIDLLADSGEPASPPSAEAAMSTRTAPCLVFEQVAYAHADDRPLLECVDLRVPAGSRLTLAGASGSGKSTLLDLLMGLATPRSGRILVDGRELVRSSAGSWRDSVAWVSQRPHVFHGSLRDNLLIARPDADEPALRRAIRFAALGDVVGRLAHGLDTPLGEHGAGLSGGELQRLAIARAWLRDAPVLLLDEPTQHLDAATARLIDQALDALGQGRTVVRVAHRLDTLAGDETVAVLSRGRIVEHGTVRDLRARRGPFAALVAADRGA
ncbi:MAG: thiol reductant ABC exporter subunit CydD [Luteibacter sp.]